LLKNDKASGADGILADVLKCGGDAQTAVLTSTLLLCTRTEEVDRAITDMAVTVICCLGTFGPRASSEAVSHHKHGPAVESICFPCIALND